LIFVPAAILGGGFKTEVPHISRKTSEISHPRSAEGYPGSPGRTCYNVEVTGSPTAYSQVPGSMALTGNISSPPGLNWERTAEKDDCVVMCSVRLAFALWLLLAPAVLPSQTRSSFEARIAPNGDAEAVITNQSNLSMVAWIFEVLSEPCNPMEADRHIYLGYDSAIEPDGAALPPMTSRVQDIGASHCNKAGTQSPNRASLKLVLFADGSSVGDSRWLDILRRDRRIRLQRIGGAMQALKKANCDGTHQQCVSLLEKMRKALPQQEEPHVEYSNPEPFDAIIRELTEDQSAPVQNQFAALLSQLQTEHDRLERLQ
jgi:hypothetical protein